MIERKKAYLDYMLAQGKTLAYMRNVSDMSIRAVSEKVGKSKSWLSDIETGRNDIMFRDCRTLVELYGFSMTQFMSMCDAEEKRIAKERRGGEGHA